jgi:hypothetical protein
MQKGGKMDVKFLLKAECRADDIDKKATTEELERALERMLDDYCGIKAVVIVEGMTYVNEAERREE